MKHMKNYETKRRKPYENIRNHMKIYENQPENRNQRKQMSTYEKEHI